MPDGVFNVLTGAGVEVGAAIAGHPGVDLVTFTGSTGVGRQVMSRPPPTAPHPARTRWQGAVCGVRRCRPRGRDPRCRGRRADQLRPGLHRRDQGHRRPPLYDDFVSGVGELMSKVGSATRRSGDRHGTADLAATPGQGRRDGRSRTRAGIRVVTGGRRLRARVLLPTNPYRRRTRRRGGVPRRDLRTGSDRALLMMTTTHCAGQRHRLRSGRLGVDARCVSRTTGFPRHPCRLCVDQRSHPDHQRDAPRRHGRIGLRQRHVDLLAR